MEKPHDSPWPWDYQSNAGTKTEKNPTKWKVEWKVHLSDTEDNKTRIRIPSGILMIIKSLSQHKQAVWFFMCIFTIHSLG